MAAAVATFFASCSENEVDSTALYGEEEFTATFADTRAELDGTAVLWNMNDELTIFTKTAHNRQYRVKELSNGNRTANFGYVTYSGTDGSKISSNYAIYPYNEQTTLNGEVITTIFNADQVYNAEKVDLGNALMVAKSSTTNLQFVNATSLLRFNVKKNIPDTFTLKSIKLTSATNKLAGEVTIDFTAGAKAVVAASGSNTVTLSGINTEITQEEQPFYIALPATNFAANDLTVTFTFDEAEKEFKLPAFDLACGTIKTMLYNINDGDDFTGTTPDGEEDFEGETPGAAPANNEIWYTSTDGNIITSSSGANFYKAISNTYENGKGVIVFDGDVKSISSRMFYSIKNLESVIIPDGVTSIGMQSFASCTSLKSATIGKSVTLIDEDAFYSCDKLLDIYCKPTTPPSLENVGAFTNTYTQRNFYVPTASVNAYKSKLNWSSFSSMIKGYDFAE